MEHAAAVVLAYLIGSIDFGVIVPQLLGVDIYSVGSGNPGASNVFRTMGKKAAGLALAGDALKGLVVVGVADIWVGGVMVFVTGFAAVVGHMFPAWHGFRGGKGVATAIGAAVWVEPVIGMILTVAWIAVVLATRMASVASLGVMVAYVPGFALAGVRGAQLWWAAAIAALVVLRHRANIARLIFGKEHFVEGM